MEIANWHLRRFIFLQKLYWNFKFLIVVVSERCFCISCVLRDLVFIFIENGAEIFCCCVYVVR